MKKLLRFMLFVAVVAAVVWATRERMLPKPPPPDAHPPPFRQHPPATTTAGDTKPKPPAEAPADDPSASTDDLQQVKGIGPVYERKLHEAGITSFVELVAADSAAIAEQLDVQMVAVVDWKTQASEFLT